MPVKVALPKGRLLRKTAALLQKAGWGLDEYQSSMGFYRPKAQKFPGLIIRVFHEKDIPIQIAIGNYDLGICGLDWLEELLVKYPGSNIIKVKDLTYGAGSLYMAAASVSLDFKRNGAPLRIVSEYPNLAEAYALQKRMSRFSVFPVWGAAEAYPPENAEMSLLSADNAGELPGCGIIPVDKVLDYSACLVANSQSWENKDLDKIVNTILDTLPVTDRNTAEKKDIVPPFSQPVTVGKIDKDTVRVALPDGHQQQQTIELLERAGIKIDDYPSESGNRRPRINLEGAMVKVIRPQDMPLQVANGNFDLAITGRDWLTDHLAQFPSSPAQEVLDLKLRKVRLVAVVSHGLEVDSAERLRDYTANREEPFRLASEYVNIADKYARDNHLGYYRVIPTWGATEAFLPDDADLLIENTETGRTIARHNLKIIDTLFTSTACLVSNKSTAASYLKKERIAKFVGKLKAAISDG